MTSRNANPIRKLLSQTTKRAAPVSIDHFNPKPCRMMTSKEITQHANQLYETMKKLDPNIRIPQYNCVSGIECLAEPCKTTRAFLSYSTPKHELSLESFEKCLLKVYHIDELFKESSSILSYAENLCDVKFKMDLDIKDLDIESRKQMQDRARIPNRTDVMMLEKWLTEKLENIMLDKEPRERYYKNSYIYFLVLLEISRQVYFSHQDSILCLERGKLFTKCLLNYFKLQQSQMAECEKEQARIKESMSSVIKEITSKKSHEVNVLSNESLAVLFYIV
jgi:hypothetical protein